MSTITEPVEHWAEHRPDDKAVVTQDRTWTWAERRDDVRRVAGGLKAAGVARGDRVAFLDKNTPACVQVTLGAASIGVANAVLNWRLAGDELDYVINDSGAKVLFVGPDLVDRVTGMRDRLEHVVEVVAVGGDGDAFMPWLADAEPAAPDPEIGDDDICLVIYSSGTTGRPKGVVISQKALVAHTVNVAQTFPFVAEHSANLVAMPLFHVGGSSYFLFGLHAGVPSIMTRDPDLPSFLWALDQGATHAFLVPAVIALILDAGDDIVAAVGGLEFLGYGASPMPLPALQRALKVWPEMNFFQVYGMTECCGVVTTLHPEAHRDEAHPKRLGSAGTLVPGVELRIVNPESGEDAAEGEPGELWFRTDQCMTGYLNKPDATAEVITEDGWLRSGDVGRQDDGGFIFIEDRVKDMIITGGENVYSPEVERVLLEHGGIAEAAVIGIPDDRWGETVKAVIVPASDSEASDDDIIAFCKERLASYKCPRSIDRVDELPRNPTGKVLKKELRKPYWSNRERQV